MSDLYIWDSVGEGRTLKVDRFGEKGLRLVLDIMGFRYFEKLKWKCIIWL